VPSHSRVSGLLFASRLLPLSLDKDAVYGKMTVLSRLLLAVAAIGTTMADSLAGIDHVVLFMQGEYSNKCTWRHWVGY
jgi:hypothetical protein